MPTSFHADRITLFCFGASYAVTLLLELAHLFRPWRLLRWASAAFGVAGLLAHSAYLAVQNPPLGSQYGTLLFVAWVLAVFSVYGSLHHARVAWAVFVLPVVLALIGLAAAYARPDADAGFWLSGLLDVRGERFWGIVHGILLLLAAVGCCVAFIASVMYLLQLRRLKAKTLPTEGIPLLSLERLEEMNRRALSLAFPLLTAGILIGMGLLVLGREHPVQSWLDPRVLSAAVLWVVFALLLYAKFAAKVRGRRVALLTIVAFLCLLLTLAVPHTLGQGAVP
jgi:ABC-type transport system involved in cytochrome c biogenesis permease subunit